MTTPTASALLEAVPTGLFINGVWREARSGSTLDLRDPSNGAVLASIADASPADGLLALDAAVAAAEGGASTPPRVRGDVLRSTFDLVQQRKDEIALLITLEMGEPLAEAAGEVAYSGDFCAGSAKRRYAFRVATRSPRRHGADVVSHRPVGPAYLITPWNFPLATVVVGGQRRAGQLLPAHRRDRCAARQRDSA